MATPTLYTGKQMLLDYYNKQKNTALTLDDVVFGTPERRDEVGALTNSWVRIYPAKGSGLTGAPKIYYDRVHMSYVGSIVVDKGTAIRTHDLLDKINDKYNTVFSPDDVENELLDPVAIGEIFITLKLKPESVTYYDGDIIYTNRYPDPSTLPQPEIEKMATWSIADSSINAVITNGELTTEVNRSNLTIATLSLNAPKTYFEVKVESNGAVIGLVRKDAAKTNPNGFVMGGDNMSWGLNTATGMFHHNGQSMQYCAPIPSGSTIGVLVDLTSGVLYYQVGNVTYGVAAIGLEQFNDLYPAVCGAAPVTQSKLTANFGQAPMANTPPYDFRRGVYTVKEVLPGTGTGGYDVPDAGTLFDTYCKGQDLWGVLADGEGGVVTSLLQSSSYTCGAAANIVANLSTNPAEIEIAKGTLAETTFRLDRGLEEPVNFLVSASYEGDANVTYHGALQVRIGASAVNNINGGKITIPAGDTTFIIRTMLTSSYVAKPGDAIKISVVVDPGYAGLITNTEPVVFNVKLLDQSNLPVGTLISTYCNGFTNTGVYADGIGGTYEEVIEGNSEACGYVPFVLRTVRVTGTGTLELPLGVDNVSIDGQGSEGTYSKYRIGGVAGIGVFESVDIQTLPIDIRGAILNARTYSFEDTVYFCTESTSVYKTKDFVNFEIVNEIIELPVRFKEYFYSLKFNIDDLDPTKKTIDLVKTKDFITFDVVLKGSTKYDVVNYTDYKPSNVYSTLQVIVENEVVILRNNTYIVDGVATSEKLITFDFVNFQKIIDIQNSIAYIGEWQNSRIWPANIVFSNNKLYILDVNGSTATNTSIYMYSKDQPPVKGVFPKRVRYIVQTPTGIAGTEIVSYSDLNKPENGTGTKFYHTSDCVTFTEIVVSDQCIVIQAAFDGVCFARKYNKDPETGTYISTYTNVRSIDAQDWHPVSLIPIYKLKGIYFAKKGSPEFLYSSEDLVNWEFRGIYKDRPGIYPIQNDYGVDTIDGFTFYISEDLNRLTLHKLQNKPGAYNSSDAGAGENSYVKIGSTRKLFSRGSLGVLPPVETNIFTLDPAIQHTVEYFCAGKTLMDINFTARKVNYPLAGTTVSESCIGYDKVLVQNTGNNTTLTTTVDENSLECGYNYDFKKEIRLTGSGVLSIPKGTTSVKVVGRGSPNRERILGQAVSYIPFYFEKIATDVQLPVNFKPFLRFQGKTYAQSNNDNLIASFDNTTWVDSRIWFPENIVSESTWKLNDLRVHGQKLYIAFQAWLDTNDNGYREKFYLVETTNGVDFNILYSEASSWTSSDIDKLTIGYINGSTFGLTRTAENGAISNLASIDGGTTWETYSATFSASNANVYFTQEFGYKIRIDEGTFEVNGKTFSLGISNRIRVNGTGEYIYPNYRTILIEWTSPTTCKIHATNNNFGGSDPNFREGGSRILYLDNKYIYYYTIEGVHHATISSDLETWTVVPLQGIPPYQANSYTNFDTALYEENKYRSVFNNGNEIIFLNDYGRAYVTSDGINFTPYIVPAEFRYTYDYLYADGSEFYMATHGGTTLYKIKPVQIGQTIITSYETAGVSTVTTIADDYTILEPVQDNNAVNETKTILLDQIRKNVLNYIVPTDGFLSVEYMGVDDNVPAPGTLISSGCDGYIKFNTLADGRGGQYRENVEYNSADCGYVPPVVMTRLYGKAAISLMEGMQATEMFYIGTALEVDLGIDVVINIGQQTLNGITFSYGYSADGVFTPFTTTASLTIPAGSNSFYIKIVTVDDMDVINAVDITMNYVGTLNANRIEQTSLTSTRVIIADKEYEPLATRFGLGNVIDVEAAVTTDGVTGYADDTAMLLTEYSVDVRKYYFEMDYRSGVESIGFVDLSGPTSDTNGGIYPGSNATSWGISSQYTYHNGVATDNGIVWGEQTVGISIDGSTGAVHLYLDGVDQGLVFTAVKTSELKFAVGSRDTDRPVSFSFNFGQRPMKFPQTGFINGFGQLYVKGSVPKPVPPSDGYITPTSLNPDTAGLGAAIYSGYVAQVNEYSNVRTTIPMGIGQSYWEVWPLNEQNGVIGIVTANHPFSSVSLDAAYVGATPHSWGISSDGTTKYHNGVAEPTGLTRNKNLPICFRYDKYEKIIYVDTGSGFTSLFLDISEDVYPAVSAKSISVDRAVFFVNFGQTTFTRTLYDPSWRGVGTPTRPPFSGTPLSKGCEGFNYGTYFADGNGGQYFSVEQSDSEQCGYVISSQFFESTNLSKLFFSDGDTVQVNANFQEGPYTVFSKNNLNAGDFYFEVYVGEYSRDLYVGVGSKEQTSVLSHPGNGPNRVVINLANGEIWDGGETPNTTYIPDAAAYTAKLGGDTTVGFYYRGSTTKQLSMIFQDGSFINVPVSLDESDTIKMLVGVDTMGPYDVMINQGQYSYGYYPTPPSASSIVTPLTDQTSFWSNTRNGLNLIANKSGNSSISTYPGVQVLLGKENFETYKYYWTLSIPSSGAMPLVGISTANLSSSDYNLRTAQGVMVIDCATGGIYCDGVRTDFPAGEWETNILYNTLTFLYDGSTRTIKLRTSNGQQYDLPFPAGTDPMTMVVGCDNPSRGINYLNLNYGADQIYGEIPAGYGTIINPWIPNDYSQYWVGSILTRNILTYGYKETMMDSIPGFESVINNKTLDTGAYYWEVKVHPTDQASMIGIADASLPTTSIPGSVGTNSIAFDTATRTVIRSDGTVFNTLVPVFEGTELSDYTLGMQYDVANHVFSMIVNYTKYDFPLLSAPADARIVVACGSDTKGIPNLAVNMGQDDYYYGLPNDTARVYDFLEPPPGGVV